MTRPERGWWLVLRDVLRRRRRTLAGFFAWSAVQATPALLSGHLVALALDTGFRAGRPLNGFGWLAVMAAGILIGAAGTRQAYRRLAAVVEPFRDELARLTVTGVLRHRTGYADGGDPAAVARLTHQVEVVRESFASMIMVAQGVLVTTTSAMFGLLTLEPLAVTLVLPPLLLGLTVFGCSLRAIATRQRASILAEERIADSTTLLAGGLRDVVACGGEDQVAATTGEHIDAQRRTTTALARLAAVRTLALGIAGWSPVVLLLAGAPWLVAHGATTGTLVGALTYLVQAVQPTLQTLASAVSGSGLWLVTTLGRLLDATRAGQSPAPARVPTRTRPHGHQLDLRGVTFSYGHGAEPVLRNLDLAVAPGDHLAVVGPSGAGKSTLAALITGVLHAQRGQIRFGGTDLRDLAPTDLARARVLIPQEAYVFAGTLADNLRYLRADASEGQLRDAADQVGMRFLVDRLRGFDTPFDPALLSAGERQLITLTRAFLSPAPLVVLDEATCHLDPAAEAVAEQAFARRPGTLLVIAHRMSSALRARRILVLDGTRAAIGTHEELLAGSPLYRDLTGYWQARQEHARPMS